MGCSGQHSRQHGPQHCASGQLRLYSPPLVKSARGGGEFFDNAEVQNKRKAAENEEPEGKRRKIQQGVKSSVEVDPMKPIFPGGHGPPRTCRWKGLQAPFHDGGGLASPGRWPPSRRKKVLGEEWTKIRLQLRMEAVKRLGSVAEV